MPTKLDLQQDMKNAMKAKDTVRLGVIRFLLAEIRNWEIDHGDASASDIEKLVQRQVKQLKDGIVEFTKAGRMDLVSAEQEKCSLLEQYLPAQMSDTELIQEVTRILEAATDKSLGVIMKQVMATVGNKADGSRISAEVKRQLLNS